jgi:hypothetical protein
MCGVSSVGNVETFFEAILILGGLVCVALVLSYWADRKKRQTLAAARARWQAEGKPIGFPPQWADYYGSEPREQCQWSASGALYFGHDCLIFGWIGKHMEELRVPFQAMRWIGTHSVIIKAERSGIEKDVLVVHYEQDGAWQVGTWGVNARAGMVQAISQSSGLPMHLLGDQRVDYGPAPTTCFLRDGSGAWQPVAVARLLPDVPASPFSTLTISQGSLYLAPDRLLFDYRYTIPLAQMRRVDIAALDTPPEERPAPDHALLWIEFTGDSQLYTVGFLLQEPERWVAILARRAPDIVVPERPEIREAQQHLLEQLEEHSPHINQVRTRWQHEGRNIRFAPVKARYYGDAPDHLNLTPDEGALGLVDDRLLFVGESSANFQLAIPFPTIRWISQLAESAALKLNILTIYAEVGSEWRLYQVGVTGLSDLVQAIQQVTSVPISTQSDYGPAKALRVRQNLLGQWERDHTVSLYLAPDRLLADWRSAVPLDAIRGLAVLPATGLQFNDAALLRISHTDPDGRPQTVGFELSSSQAQAWAEILSRRTGISIDYESGRKKKEDE